VEAATAHPVLEAARALTLGGLLTLTGRPGVGKSYMARLVADLVSTTWSRTRVWIDLASARDEVNVPYRVAVGVGTWDRYNRSIVDSIVECVAEKPHLVVLDNCDNVAAVCRDLVEAFRRGAPDALILVTNRVPLGAPGECEQVVKPLAVPDEDDQATVESLCENPSVRLFVELARQVYPQFRVTAENMAALKTLCRRLEGVPAQIALVAAWADRFDVGRADHEVALALAVSQALGSNGHDAALAALVHWACERVKRSTFPASLGKGIFEASAVFAGDCDRAALKAQVSWLSDEQLDAGIAELVQRGLLVETRGADTPRYSLDSFVRPYAASILASNGSSANQSWHTEHYASIADTIEAADAENAHAKGKRTNIARVYGDEKANLQAALKWKQDEFTFMGDGEELRLGLAVNTLCRRMNFDVEAERWLGPTVYRHMTAYRLSPELRGPVNAAMARFSRFGDCGDVGERFTLRHPLRWARRARARYMLKDYLKYMGVFDRASGVSAAARCALRPRIGDAVAAILRFEQWRPVLEFLSASALIGALLIALATVPWVAWTGLNAQPFAAIQIVVAALLGYAVAVLSVGWFSETIGLIVVSLTTLAVFGVLGLSAVWFPFAAAAPAAAALAGSLLFGSAFIQTMIDYTEAGGLRFRSIPAQCVGVLVVATCLARPDVLPSPVASAIAGIDAAIRYGLASGVAAYGMFLLLNLIVGGALAWIQSRVWRTKARTHPVDDIIASLLECLRLVGETPRAGAFPRGTGVDRQLESIARRLEDEYSWQFHTGDAETATWFGDKMRALALDVRRLKHLVLLPEVGAREAFERAVSGKLVCAAEGRWGELGQSTEPVVSPPRRSLRAQMVTITRQGFSVLVPFGIAAFLVTQQSALPKEAVGTIVTALALWGAVNSMAIVNPGALENLSTVNSLAEGLKKKSGKGEMPEGGGSKGETPQGAGAV
jgi:hypothetical protein